MEKIALLFYSLCFLLGVAAKLVFHPLYFLLFFILLFFWKNRTPSGTLLALAGFFFATYSTTLPTLPDEGVTGSGTFVTDSISHTSSPFGSSLITKGSLKTFSTPTHTWHNVPCQLYFLPHKPRPLGHVFDIQGTLLPKQTPHYVLKPTSIQSRPSLFPLPEYRFKLKNALRRHFIHLFPHPETSSFLLSMVTGEIDNRLLSLQFNRLGLLHLLGISGFQFSLLALLLSSLFKTFLKPTLATYLLIALLSTYAFFLGNAPPIQRAYITFLLYAIASLAHYQISPLNALGASLLWALFLDPCVIFQLGFQFSFLCTTAIFTVYPFFRSFLPRRPFSLLRSLPLFDRIGYVLFSLISSAALLNFAIHLVSLPLLLYHFHKFSFLSLIYNLFLPPIASLAYLLLIPGLLLYPLFPLLLSLTSLITQEMLLIACNPPLLFDFQWRTPSFTFGWALLSLSLLLFLTLRYFTRAVASSMTFSVD